MNFNAAKWMVVLVSMLGAGCATGGMHTEQEQHLVVPDRAGDPTTDGSNTPATEQSTSLSKCIGSDCSKCADTQTWNASTQSCEDKPCGGACRAGQFCDSSSGRCMNDVLPASAPGH